MVIVMGRRPTGRTTKLVRVLIKFEQEVKAFISSLKENEISLGQNSYFSIDGGRTNLGNFSTGKRGLKSTISPDN